VIHKHLRDHNQPVLALKPMNPGCSDAEYAFPPINRRWMSYARVVVAAGAADDFARGSWKLVTFFFVLFFINCFPTIAACNGH